MAWQDPTDPDSKLKLKLTAKPLLKVGFVLKLWGVGLGMMLALAVVGLVGSLATVGFVPETFSWFWVALGLGLLFGLYLLIAWLTGFWDKL